MYFFKEILIFFTIIWSFSFFSFLCCFSIKFFNYFSENFLRLNIFLYAKNKKKWSFSFFSFRSCFLCFFFLSLDFSFFLSFFGSSLALNLIHSSKHISDGRFHSKKQSNLSQLMDGNWKKSSSLNLLNFFKLFFLPPSCSDLDFLSMLVWFFFSQNSRMRKTRITDETELRTGTTDNGNMEKKKSNE